MTRAPSWSSHCAPSSVPGSDPEAARWSQRRSLIAWRNRRLAKAETAAKGRSSSTVRVSGPTTRRPRWCGRASAIVLRLGASVRRAQTNSVLRSAAHSAVALGAEHPACLEFAQQPWENGVMPVTSRRRRSAGRGRSRTAAHLPRLTLAFATLTVELGDRADPPGNPHSCDRRPQPRSTKTAKKAANASLKWVARTLRLAGACLRLSCARWPAARVDLGALHRSM